MIKLLFGNSKADNEIADILNMLLMSFHRIHVDQGEQFVVEFIKASQFLTDFSEDKFRITFTMGAELSEFEFVTNIGRASSPPWVQVMGFGSFVGFHSLVDLGDGGLMAGSRSSPTLRAARRAGALADIFCKRLGAMRMPF